MQAEPTVEAPSLTSPHAALDPVRVVEAALFSAGKPIALDEIVENTRLPKREVTDALKRLIAEYDARDTSLEVARAGDKWAMQVRAKYAPAAQRLAPMEIPIKLLKTLALVAYHQPMMQSTLVDMVGAKAYEHVHELAERGLVKRRVHERSFLLVTSESFPEYFGIPASNRDEIKVFLANKLGIPVSRKAPDGSASLDAFPAAAPEGQPREPQTSSPSP